MNMKTKISTAILGAFLLAAPVSAATMNVTQQGPGLFVDANGLPGWYQQMTVNYGGTSRTLAAGAMQLQANRGGEEIPFLAFCLEPLTLLSLPGQYSIGTTLSSSVVANLDVLISNALKLVVDSTTAAAFQLAAWEIANEKTGTFDVLSGDFYMIKATGWARRHAQDWLALISNGTWTANGKGTILTAPGNQDLLTNIPAAVPLPAAGFGLLAALAGLAGFRRRAKAAGRSAA